MDNSPVSSCDTSDTDTCSLPVNSASLLRRQSSQKAPPVRGHVLQKAKVGRPTDCCWWIDSGDSAHAWVSLPALESLTFRVWGRAPPIRGKKEEEGKGRLLGARTLGGAQEYRVA